MDIISKLQLYPCNCMGLNISGNVVDVDHGHNQHLNTGLSGNPVVQCIPADFPVLKVYSTYRRHKAPQSKNRQRATRQIGDNCHLLYALKGKDDLTTTYGAIRRLLQHFDTILEDVANRSGPFDVVIPMPSAHGISRLYASRLARRFGCPINTTLLSKISGADALQLLRTCSLGASDKRRIAARLCTDCFSLKDVPPRFRHHFPPVTLNPGGIPSRFTRFLLADDLLSTGTTLLAARKLILDAIPGAVVEASCLFSAI